MTSMPSRTTPLPLGVFMCVCVCVCVCVRESVCVCPVSYEQSPISYQKSSKFDYTRPFVEACLFQVDLYAPVIGLF